jgi:hypothetical protein
MPDNNMTLPTLVLKEHEVAEQEFRNSLHLMREDKYYVGNGRISRALIDKLGIEDAKDIAKYILDEAHHLQMPMQEV